MNEAQEHRSRLKVLRGEKKVLVEEIRVKRSLKKGIDAEMIQLRIKIKASKAQV